MCIVSIYLFLFLFTENRSFEYNRQGKSINNIMLIYIVKISANVQTNWYQKIKGNKEMCTMTHTFRTYSSIHIHEDLLKRLLVTLFGPSTNTC